MLKESKSAKGSQSAHQVESSKTLYSFFQVYFHKYYSFDMILTGAVFSRSGKNETPPFALKISKIFLLLLFPEEVGKSWHQETTYSLLAYLTELHVSWTIYMIRLAAFPSPKKLMI